MPVDYSALAKQFGGTTTPAATTTAAPGGVDYAAIARQFGGKTTPATNPHQGAIDVINGVPPPPSAPQRTDIGTGLLDAFGGSGANDLKSAMTERNPLMTGAKLASGFGKAAFDAATFIPKGIFNTTKDFAKEAWGNTLDLFNPKKTDWLTLKSTPPQPHSDLTQNAEEALQAHPTDTTTSGHLDRLSNAFLGGLSATAPFLGLYGETDNLPDNTNNIRGGKAFNQQLASVKDNFVAKQAAALDQKLGLDTNSKASVAARKAAAKTGAKTPGQVLAENNIPLDNNTVAALDEHAAVRQATKQALLKTEGNWGTLDDFAQQAKDNLQMTGTDLDKAKAIIDQELKAYKAQFGSKGQIVDGKLRLPLDQADKVKAGLWKQSYGKNLVKSDTLASQARWQFGNAIKNGITDLSESDVIKELNRQEGDFINAKKALDGKDVAKMGKASFMSRLTRKTVGAAMGSVGGIPGSIVGAELADYVGEVLHNADIPAAVRQNIIDNLKGTSEGAAVLDRANAQYNARIKQTVERPQLPPNTTQFAGPRTYDQQPATVSPAEPAVARNPKTGQMFRYYKSTPKK